MTEREAGTGHDALCAIHGFTGQCSCGAAPGSFYGERVPEAAPRPTESPPKPSDAAQSVTPPADRVTDGDRQCVPFYACRWCGWSPTNTASWCDLGCGRDYNEMIALPESVARQLAEGNDRIERLTVELRELAARPTPEQPGSGPLEEDAPEELRAEDLKFDTYSAGESCRVRITHLPTGRVGTSELHRSELAAKQEALTRLRTAGSDSKRWPAA